MMKQSSDLIGFISSFQISEDGTVPYNSMNDRVKFESTMYKPTYQVSILSLLMWKHIKQVGVPMDNSKLPYNCITNVAINSDLSQYAPDVYLLLQTIVLEAFSIGVNVREGIIKMDYISKSDIMRIKENCSYIMDYMGYEEKYVLMIECMRNIHLALGYLENQLDIVISRGGQGLGQI